MKHERPCHHCAGTGKEVDPVALGKQMRLLRTRAGLSLREMARRMEVSAPYLCDLELGRRGWPPARITAFKRGLDTPAQKV